jgi:hypothetical protein
VALADRAAVEFFHLVFLRALVGKGQDKALVALKGGCNLRFYFGSVRYSEDIDFDVAVISKETLKNKVERLLQSPLVGAPLKTQGLIVQDVSAPKQTGQPSTGRSGWASQLAEYRSVRRSSSRGAARSKARRLQQSSPTCVAHTR